MTNKPPTTKKEVNEVGNKERDRGKEVAGEVMRGSSPNSHN